MRQFRTETTIHAPAPVVWEVLTDFRRYPEWNPFITSAIGSPRAGELLRVRMRADRSGPVIFRPQVVRAVPRRELAWRGRLGPRGLFAGEHRFIIEPLGSHRVRFVQEELFRGLLVPLLGGRLRAHLPRAFEAMNAALKARAEEIAAAAAFAGPRTVG